MIATSNLPLISVVIPTYNRAELICRAIDSVLDQSYQNLEIIVVDDHSQDNTADIVKGIDDRRIQYHCHPNNQGGSAARNTGIKLARGQYIAFLDSDDVWLPQKLALQLQAIAERAINLDRLVSYTKFQKSNTVFYQPSVLPQRGKKPTESVADYFWLGNGEMLTSTLFVSSSLAKAYLFQTNLRKHQDLDFVLRLGFQDAEFIFIPNILTIWHNESRSDRVSQISNYQFSLDWIENYRAKISERSYKGFLFKEVVPKMLKDEKTKAKALKMLVGGFFQRTISINFFLFLIIQQATSKKLKNYLKAILMKVKQIRNT